MGATSSWKAISGKVANVVRLYRNTKDLEHWLVAIPRGRLVAIPGEGERLG
jgi:hypothetical protein